VYWILDIGYLMQLVTLTVNEEVLRKKKEWGSWLACQEAVKVKL